MTTPKLSIDASTASPNVYINNGKTVTTSIAIAEYFQKTHDNVLKKIRSTISECDDEYHVVNFNEMFLEIEVANGALRKTPYYELTRDAFVLIAMGFTGKKALKWKINYINTFNRMEAELHNSIAVTGATNKVLLTLLPNGKVDSARVIHDNEYVASLESLFEIGRRAGYMIIHKDELIKKLSE
ncbi:Rha family transcriptional regulator [Candidatus Arsenophonus triatominarum]|uniref:Rha family transcriptional regulator n=1 Tax=Candidatus Arsenophonus triatominarum TaxID=57911 RepID=UPI0007C4F123|nr:Rha family transcriptional regulator [Candidatus Arsenophonus triatominarum]